MDKEMMEQFQMILQGMADMEGRLNKRIDSVENKIEASETRTQIYIENAVTKKIEALFDGYKLTHEKQWEMERKLEELERRIERLEIVG